MTTSPDNGSANINNNEDNGVLYLSKQEMIQAAKKHVTFLQQLHQLGTTLTTPSFISLDRYLNYWLPLVAAHCQNNATSTTTVHLIPPPDIAWLWHCHRLAPAPYQRHVSHRFRTWVEAPQEDAFEFQTPTDTREKSQQTRKLWEQLYPGKPFFLTWNGEDNNDTNEEMLIGTNHQPNNKHTNTTRVNLQGFLQDYPLLESCERQATFLWQVSGPKYSDDQFLLEGVQNYMRFLNLYKLQLEDLENCNGDTKQRLPLVPTYQIDLMWHTHMLQSPRLYQRDCLRLTGQAFPHDDSMNDRTTGGKLDRCFQSTIHLWKKVYGSQYIVEGGMYRGEPTSDYWEAEWHNNFKRQGYLLSADEERLVKTVVVAGSFSAGEVGVANPNLPQVWLHPAQEIYYEGLPTFIPAAAKSKTVGTNSNQAKENYVFGLPTREYFCTPIGTGYYHMYTKEGWQILTKRLQKRMSAKRNQHENYLCNQCVCSAKSLTPQQMAQYEALEKEYNDLATLYFFARAQLEAAGPGAPIPPAAMERYQLNKRTVPEHYRRDTTAYAAGCTYFVYYDMAGCGGGDGGAAGCGGGGACGAGGTYVDFAAAFSLFAGSFAASTKP